MNPEPLPPDLRDLEDQLARRPCPEAAAEFRARVLSAMASSQALPVSQPAARGWRLVWQAAAAVILALNLGMSAANGIRFQRLTPLAVAEGNMGRRLAGPEVANAADADDRFQVLAASALASLRPAPDAGALGRQVFSNEEERRWALP